MRYTALLRRVSALRGQPAPGPGPDPDPPGPQAPTNFQAVATSPTAIQLSWQDTNDGLYTYGLRRGGSLIHTTARGAEGYLDTGRTPATPYSYEIRTEGMSSGPTASATTPAEPEPGELFANMPSGMTILAEYDGTVIGGTSGDNPAFGIPGFGSWFGSGVGSNLTLVDDPTNPYGSGTVLRQLWPGGDANATASMDRFSGGPYDEVYFQTSVFYEPGWAVGHKLYYFGADVPSRSQNDNTNHYVHQAGASMPGTLRVTTQNGASINFATAHGAIVTGVWLNIEVRCVIGSATTGQSYLYVNGDLKSAVTNCNWQCLGFDGWRWYGNSNGGPNGVIRIGGFRLAGRNL